MPKSIQERVRAAIAKQDASRKAAEYKAGEHDRRSQAARFAAAVRRDQRDDDIIRGRAIPRNAREDALQCRALYGDGEEWDLPGLLRRQAE
jgi:hypothetical protein